ncbi:MAG: hypothetical protein IJJ03_10260 [Mogibacterium sp.]|nr:hypothetical protein [Mogibacterium sp.]MBQ6502163.1 hypothetical protein [Mogibacterium sp.]
MKKYWTIILIAIIAVSAAACGSSQEEAAPATDEPVTAEEYTEEPEPVQDQEPVQYIEPQGDFPVDLIGKWGEPIEMGLIINIKEDGTLSAYHLNEDDPDGELLYYMDGTWHVEGQEVCIRINGTDLYYSYDEGSQMLVDREGTHFYVPTDKGIIP